MFSFFGMTCCSFLIFRHQAEITVMQLRGHSLPVHQSMSVSWAFILSHFVSQIRLRDFFRLLAIWLCPSLPVHHFRMACLARPKVKIKQYPSSCRAGSTNIPDPLFPLLPIVYHPRQILGTASRILTQLLNVCSCWSSCFCTAMCGGP